MDPFVTGGHSQDRQQSFYFGRHPITIFLGGGMQVSLGGSPTEPDIPPYLLPEGEEEVRESRDDGNGGD